MKKYYQCLKCGKTLSTRDEDFNKIEIKLCTDLMPLKKAKKLEKLSAICGGRFYEITEEQYNKLKNEKSDNVKL